MASRYQNFIKGIGLVPNTTGDANTKKGDLNVIGTGLDDGKLAYHNGSTSSPVVTEAHASQGVNRLKSKDLEDATTAIVDSSDTTKKIIFDVAGSTGTSTTLLSSQTSNRVLTLPNATDTLVGTATSDVLTNKTLSGNTASSLINGAGTINFNSSGTITVPNTTDTLVGKETSDTLKNKSISASDNTISGLTNANLSGTAGITNANLANSTISGISLGSNLVDLTAGTGLAFNSGTTYNGGTARTISIDSSVVTLTGSQVLTNKTLTSPVLNTPTADTITGIAGGAFTLQSASNQNVNIQAQGSGLVQIENYTFNASTLSTIAGVGMIISPSAGSITMASSPPMSGGGAIIFGTRAAFDTEVLLTSGTAVTVSTNNSHVSFRGAGLVSIAGFVSNKTGEVIYIDNNTGSPITILNDSVSATSSNRIITGTGEDIILENGASIAIIYSGYAISKWVVVGGTGGAGGWSSYIQNSLTNGGNVTITTKAQQAIEVAGSGGPVILSSTPFGSSTPNDKTVVRLFGTSDTNTVTINSSDVAKGVYVNGQAVLFLGYVIDFMYIASINRWMETSRNF